MSNTNIITKQFEGTEVQFKMINNESYVRINEVARFCGWEKTEIKNGKEYKSLRMATINKFLKEMGFDNKMAKGDFIPEYIMYPLIGKANNERATKFMLWVGQVVVQLRTTGVVITEKATEEAIDFEKKYGIYRIRKTFTNSTQLRADYNEFNKLAKENRLSGQDRIKRLNIIFDSIQKKLNTNLNTLRGSEMLSMQELLTDISQDTKKLSNKVNGGIKTGQTKMIKKQQDFIEWIYPDNDEYNVINYHGFSIDCIENYNKAYWFWKKNFPEDKIVKQDLDFNKPVYIWLKFDHKNDFDVTNFHKTFIDRLCAIYNVDDKYIQIKQCETNKYVDHYTDGKCYYILKQGEWEVGE